MIRAAEETTIHVPDRSMEYVLRSNFPLILQYLSGTISVRPTIRSIIVSSTNSSSSFSESEPIPMSGVVFPEALPSSAILLDEHVMHHVVVVVQLIPVSFSDWLVASLGLRSYPNVAMLCV